MRLDVSLSAPRDLRIIFRVNLAICMRDHLGDGEKYRSEITAMAAILSAI